MNKKIIKNIIIILIILVLLLIGIIIFLNKKDNENVLNNKEELTDDNPILTIDLELDELKNESMLIALEKIVTNENKDIDKFYAQKIYYNTIKFDEQSQYYIYGIYWKNSYKEKHNIYITIDMQEEKMLYSYDQSTIDITFQQFLSEINKIDKTKISTNINFDENKKVNYLEYDTATKIERYYDYYIDLVQYDAREAYELLDENYREKRFGNLENYLNYIKEYKNIIINDKLQKYTVKYFEDEDKYQYACLDINNKYLIINEKKLLDYSILLDEYTIDIPQFVEKYNDSDEQNKVALNIDKFIKGINDKNYNYSYSILADSFKQNKFPSINLFEQAVKNEFFENCSIEYSVFNEQGNNYVYSVVLRDTNSNNTKNMIIVMKLGDETDFEMSYSFE